MTDDELRRKIAELKGWKDVEDRGGILHLSGRSPEYPEYLNHCPNWPVNIADAWELVEEMRFVRMREYGDGVWHCSVYDSEGSLEVYGADKSAPRSISLAYIQYREGKNKV